MQAPEELIQRNQTIQMACVVIEEIVRRKHGTKCSISLEGHDVLITPTHCYC